MIPITYIGTTSENKINKKLFREFAARPTQTHDETVFGERHRVLNIHQTVSKFENGNATNAQANLHTNISVELGTLTFTKIYPGNCRITFSMSDYQ